MVFFDFLVVRCDKEDYFLNKIFYVFKFVCCNFKKLNLSSVGFVWEIIVFLYCLFNGVIIFEIICLCGLLLVIYVFLRVNKGVWSRCVRFCLFYLFILDWSL